MIRKTTSAWPAKYPVLGVEVSATTPAGAADSIIAAARRGESAVVAAHPVHAIVECGGDPELRAAVNRFEMVTPDGQPVRWAMNLLHRAQLPERVCGPQLMLDVCRRAAAEGLPIYLYGSVPETLARLQANLGRRCPGLRVVGAESPPFRPLTPEEDAAMVARVNNSGARIMFLGLGCPKQDRFAAEHRERLRLVQVCVGAAFDFHAGVKRIAPPWMQRTGLEWLFRLSQEPRRLFRRYAVSNSVFLARFVREVLTDAFGCGPRPDRTRYAPP